MTLTVTPALTGLAASPALAAEAVSGPVSATGGCWAFLQEPVTSEGEPTLLEQLDAPSKGDRPVEDGGPAVEWSAAAEGATLDLTSTGGTSTDGEARQISLTLANGPVLDSLRAVAGKAYAVIQVKRLGLDSYERVVAEAPFEAAAGAAVTAPVAPGAGEETTAPGAAAPVPGEEAAPTLTFTLPDGYDLEFSGKHTLTLESVFFQEELPAESTAEPVTWVCNAQSETTPEANPQIAPVVMEDVTDSFNVLGVQVLRLEKIQGQRTTTAARPGDSLVLGALNMSASTEYRIGLREAAGDWQSVGSPVFSDEDGDVASTEILVPELAAGPVTVSLLAVGEDGLFTQVGATIDVEILAAPVLSVTETVNDESISLAIVGSGFDPAGEVRMRARTEDSGAGPVISAQADASGAFSATYEVSNEDATQIRATQQRVDGFPMLQTSYEINGELAGPTTPPPTDEPTPTANPNPNTPSVPTTPPLPSDPPVEIPVPDPIDTDVIDAVPAPEAAEPQLSVSDASLEGSAGWRELFGGSSKREVQFNVENNGEATAPNPKVLIGVSRTGDAVPSMVAAEVGDLEPGGRAAVAVNVALPVASFGRYTIVGQVDDVASTQFQLEWDTYPWGLIGINAAGIGLLIWGVSRRRTPVIAPTSGGGEEAGASVVDLDALDHWWKSGKVVPSLVEATEDNDSVVDLEAADRWWARNQNKVS